MQEAVLHPIVSDGAVARLTASRWVRPDTSVSSESAFSDSVWRMASVSHLPSAKASHKCWNFQSVAGFPGGFALALAEYAYHRLYKPVASHDRQGQWLTIHNELLMLRTFARFCSDQGYETFKEVDTDDYYEFHSQMTAGNDRQGPKSADRVKQIVFTVYRLWEYRSTLSEPLQSLPFGKPMEKFQRSGGSSEGNRTPAIPEEIFGPLTAAAIDYVLQFSDPILGAHSEIRKQWTNDIASTTLSDSGKRKRLYSAAKIVLKKFPAPWRQREWARFDDLERELNQLRRACIITILAFSGIRLSELLSIELGCCVQELLENGKVRNYINTVLHKHRGVGARDTWVVIDEVVQAIRVLEHLTKELRAASHTRKLLISTADNSSFSVSREPVASDTVYSPEALIFQVNAFVETCNESLARVPIPRISSDEEGGQLWHLNLRQFRRTLARYIAREPFGVIAGMLQYKHVEVTCFEGYAGCEPSWNKMLAEEKVLASVNVLDELAIDMSHGAVAGTLGNEMRARFEIEFKGRAEDFAPSQIAKWLADEKRTLYVGKFSFCLFKAEKAICTAKSSVKDEPILNACDPNHCENACVTRRHIPLWKSQLEQAEQLLCHPKASQFQKAALRSEVVKLKSVVQKVERTPV